MGSVGRAAPSLRAPRSSSKWSCSASRQAEEREAAGSLYCGRAWDGEGMSSCAPRLAWTEGRGADGGDAELVDQRTRRVGAPGGFTTDCPGRQENGARGSRESGPPEDWYKGSRPFVLCARLAGRKADALLRGRGLGRRGPRDLGRR